MRPLPIERSSRLSKPAFFDLGKGEAGMNSKVLEYPGYTIGMVGVALSALVEYGGLQIGISPMVAIAGGIVPTCTLLGLAMAFRER